MGFYVRLQIKKNPEYGNDFFGATWLYHDILFPSRFIWRRIHAEAEKLVNKIVMYIKG